MSLLAGLLAVFGVPSPLLSFRFLSSLCVGFACLLPFCSISCSRCVDLPGVIHVVVRVLGIRLHCLSFLVFYRPGVGCWFALSFFSSCFLSSWRWVLVCIVFLFSFSRYPSRSFRPWVLVRIVFHSYFLMISFLLLFKMRRSCGRNSFGALSVRLHCLFSFLLPRYHC